ncbi:serine/threonine protein kinase [Desulfocurvibacter africanus]|nr:serine/threonine protein kinase [Desulfocurvibacter africanus]
MAEDVRQLIERMWPESGISRYGRVFHDTSEFMDIGHGDVMALGGLHYLVIRDESERRFGMEDPKYWVKRCHVLETGEKRIVKLVFYETFNATVGRHQFPCYRSPIKEARILDLVREDPRFMHGFSLEDSQGNNVRVLEYVQGRRLDLQVEAMEVDHEIYFRERFPAILAGYIDACEAILFLHEHGEKHGDIRRDHLYVERGTGRYRWIDFDYAFDLRENPFGWDLFGLGNILAFLVGKGEHTPLSIAEQGLTEHIRVPLDQDDFGIIFGNRLFNLKKLFPYIPERLNRVVMHFAQGANVFYETVDELLTDLRPCLAELGAIPEQAQGGEA